LRNLIIHILRKNASLFFKLSKKHPQTDRADGENFLQSRENYTIIANCKFFRKGGSHGSFLQMSQ